MKLSHNGFLFIKELEGSKNKAYLDVAKITTIGIGFIQVNGKKVELGMSMSDQEIENEFKIQIAKYEQAVTNLVTATLNQDKFDALVSFCYNLGIGALKASTLLKKVNASDTLDNIKKEFLKWNRAGGVEVKGLTIRRQKEFDLYAR